LYVVLTSFHPKTQHFVQDRGAYEIFTAGIDDIPRIKIEYATMRLGKMIVFGSKLISGCKLMRMVKGTSNGSRQ